MVALIGLEYVAKVARRGRNQMGSAAPANKRDALAVKPCHSNQCTTL